MEITLVQGENHINFPELNVEIQILDSIYKRNTLLSFDLHKY